MDLDKDLQSLAHQLMCPPQSFQVLVLLAGHRHLLTAVKTVLAFIYFFCPLY